MFQAETPEQELRRLLATLWCAWKHGDDIADHERERIQAILEEEEACE